ncbi:TPA: NUDIX domain-containing protein [Candidatus Woesearchaeota archaeon]|nr:NUDIX domain-containing protein [Candidatus Woesearchaeota archaeon]HII68727.1 NUDIX domain-containing protein [Candidatus Woesearchaeota archaeon]
MKNGIDGIGVAAGAMVFNAKGEVLTAKRGQQCRNERGRWEFPGGAVEFGESCEQAIIRETKEELDVTIEIIGFLCLVDNIIPEEKQHWVSPSYVAKAVSAMPRIMEPDKITEWKWATLSELDEKAMTRASSATLSAYRKKYGNVPPGF